VKRGRPKAPLILTADELDILTGHVRRGKTPQRLALRARIVLLCADGQDNKAVAKRLGVTEETVGKWRARFLRRRLQGLEDEPRSGAPSKSPRNETTGT